MGAELATGLARMATLLPAQTRADLRRLLAHDLAAPSPERERAARLGLLCELLEGSGGEIPGVETYERVRHESGGSAPSASALSRAYGGWLRAVRAAGWLSAGGAGPAVCVEVEPQQRYSRREALIALESAREELGRWPGAVEYEEWARLRRRLQRRWGDGNVRTPGVSVFARLFGSFNEGVDTAKREGEGG